MARVFVLLVVAACSSTDASVAMLNKADGPVERQASGGAAGQVPVGAKFYLGDVVQTTVGGAQISLRDGAQIAMRPHTVLRFSHAGATALDIAEGEIVLDGTGTYRLKVGMLTLENGSIRIVGGNAPTLELVFGHGELAGDHHRERRPLEIGRRVILELGQGALADAGVPTLPIDAMIAGATIEVTGEGTKIQAPGETRWTTLTLGTGTLAPGSRIAVAGPATATVALPGTSVELFPGSRATVTESLELAIDGGAALTRVAPGQSKNIAVPGGRVTLPASSATVGTETTIRVDADGDANIAVIRGGAKLSGKRGPSDLDVQPGGSGLVRAVGVVTPGELVFPAYFDFEVHVGKTPNMTVHDPAGATAVQFEFAGQCKGAGVIELDRDASFRAPLISVGDFSAKLMVRTGRWAYRLRCSGNVAKSGHITVVRDPGTRALPRDPPRFEIAPDGRNYRLDYQSRIPHVYIRAAGKGSRFKLHLVSGKNERVFSSTTGSFAVPGTSLREQDYTFWVVRDDVKSRVSTLRIGFDQTAALVYVESPIDGRPWGPRIDVAGATLPGWTATIDGHAIVVDKQTRRFSAIVDSPREARAIAIQLAHPEHGVHVYLRRGQPTAASR